MEIIEHVHKIKTRKKHQCFACYGLFEKGTEMYVQVNVFDGEIARVYHCETCDQIMKDHQECCYDEVEHVYYAGCVSEIPSWHFSADEQQEYENDKTPEKILEILNRK